VLELLLEQLLLEQLAQEQQRLAQRSRHHSQEQL
jgi:hypothetical protein